MRSEPGQAAAAATCGKFGTRNARLAGARQPARFVPREEGPLAGWLRAEAAVAAASGAGGAGRAGRGEPRAR